MTKVFFFAQVVWKELPQCLKAYLLTFYRGCLFITYEVEALDKAVTIDTRAILQEKYKSYIYLKANPSQENENLTAGTGCHSPQPTFFKVWQNWKEYGHFDILVKMHLLELPSEWHLQNVLNGFLSFFFYISRCTITSVAFFPSFPSLLSFLSAYFSSVCWLISLPLVKANLFNGNGHLPTYTEMPTSKHNKMVLLKY